MVPYGKKESVTKKNYIASLGSIAPILLHTSKVSSPMKFFGAGQDIGM